MFLIVNNGSSSLKYKLFADNFEVIASKKISGIGDKVKNFDQATNMMLSDVLAYKNTITKVGYRIVYGGSEADEIMPVTLPTIQIIDKYAPLAPLHNPSAVKVIKNLIEKLPFAQHFAAFDSAFFRKLPEVAKICPINQEIASKHNIMNYGFHGISHQFVAGEVDPEKNLKIVSIHLGAGSSLAAIQNGDPIDTSMGFTPTGGIPMQNRSGDLDPEVVLFLVEKYGLKQARNIIQNESGLAGISGTSGSMLTLLILAGEKVEDLTFQINSDKTAFRASKEDAHLAIEVFCYRIKKYIGSYIAAMGGVDIIAFSGEIGSGSEVIRKKILSGLDFFDYKLNIVKPDEELAIAKKL